MPTVVAVRDPMIRKSMLSEALSSDFSIEITPRESLKDAIETHDPFGIVVDVSTPVTESCIAAGESLSIIARAGVGVDNIDISAATKNDVTVVNVPDYCTEEVSTHAVSLLLGCIRRLKPYDRAVNDGQWDWTVGEPIARLADSTIGLVSFGGLAKRTRAKLSGFDCSVIAFDPYTDADAMAAHDVEKVSFDELLIESDHLSVHAPLTEQTRHMIDADAFETAGRLDSIVNVGRGGIIDEDALVDALSADRVGMAGLDVLETEPPTEPTLSERADVVLTPHAAFYSEASLMDLNTHIGTDILAVYDGSVPEGYIDPESPWL